MDGIQNDGEDKLTLNERASLLLDYWKQISNVQQHFNDVSMKLRNFAVVVFSGFLTGVGLAIHKGICISLFQYQVSAGVLFALAGLIATQLIHFMDTYWYHVFLKGAVSTSMSIESEIKKILNVKELSDGICSSSHSVCVVSIFGKVHLPIGWKEYLKDIPGMRLVEVDSTKRHKIFYRWLLVIFIATGIGCLFTHPPKEITKDTSESSKSINVYINNVEPSEIVNTGFIISGSNVRIRSYPDFSADIIGLLPIGKMVNILHDNKDSSWIEVSYLNQNAIVQQGWIHRDFLASVK